MDMLEKQGVAHSKPLCAAWVNSLLNCNLSRELIEKRSFSLISVHVFFPRTDAYVGLI